MVQSGNKNVIGGRELIQENDHMSEIVQKQNAQNQSNRQADQKQSSQRQQGDNKNNFHYENPRQVQ